MYKEHVKAVACPTCGSITWKRHNLVSCSTVPFEAACANCGHLPDEDVNHILCPHNEFSYRLPDKVIVHHLKCYKCSTENAEFDMEMVEIADEGSNIVEFGRPGMVIGKWRLPYPWIKGKVYMDIGDDIDALEQVVFCSEECKDGCWNLIEDENTYSMEYKSGDYT